MTHHQFGWRKEEEMLGTGLLLFCIMMLFAVPAACTTDQTDVTALNDLYVALNSASQLVGWMPNGGDPCGSSWKGITCSGSRVTDVKLSSLGLTGSLGYTLDKLTSVINFNFSNNNIGVQKQIPLQLPHNIQWLDLSGNAFVGGLPYSISQMSSLVHLNVGRNQLQGALIDTFGDLPNLVTIDLSNNMFSGKLPDSFSMLSSLTTLYLQNNLFTGTIDVLANLPLENLNVANNRFTGWIPDRLKRTNYLQTDGNSWNSGPSPPSPRQKPNPGQIPNYHKKSGISAGATAGVVISLLVVVGLVLAFFLMKKKRRRSSHKEDLELDRHSTTPSSSNETNGIAEFKLKETPIHLTPLPCDPQTSFDGINENMNMIKGEAPTNTNLYSIADLQMATRSFSEENLVGEGVIGLVYRAEFDDGKVVAVKKIHSSSLPTKEASEAFMQTVSNVSRLHHPNVTRLKGYCSEHGQYLLVYEFHTNGSLHDLLHLSDGHSKPLPWNVRVNIALGTGGALEYLHEGCSPPVVLKNFKSQNIFLDEELNPRVSDCGLASLVSHTDCQAFNLDSRSGYNAPEIAMSGQYTLMSDVYSFGVVMLELLTGKKPFDRSRPRSEQSLVRWATPQLHDIDALDRMVDKNLKGFCPAKSLSRFADVVALCIPAGAGVQTTNVRSRSTTDSPRPTCKRMRLVHMICCSYIGISWNFKLVFTNLVFPGELKFS